MVELVHLVPAVKPEVGVQSQQTMCAATIIYRRLSEYRMPQLQ